MTDGAGPSDDEADVDDPDWVDKMLARALETADDDPAAPGVESASPAGPEASVAPSTEAPKAPPAAPIGRSPAADKAPADTPQGPGPTSPTRPPSDPYTPGQDNDDAWSAWAAGGSPPDSPAQADPSPEVVPPAPQIDWSQQPTQVATAAAGATAAGALLVDDDYDDELEDAPRPKSRARSIAEWVAVLVGALVIAFVIKTFLFQAFYIPSGSMEPTLSQDDRVLVNKLSYDLHDVNRGDIVVFNRPPDERGDIDHLIKRVIGLPGETITFVDGQVFIDNREVSEPYLLEQGSTDNFLDNIPNCEGSTPNGCQIPEGRVFVMGDNRRDSRDARFFGPIEESSIVGRSFLKIWPVTGIGLL